MTARSRRSTPVTGRCGAAPRHGPMHTKAFWSISITKKSKSCQWLSLQRPGPPARAPADPAGGHWYGHVTPVSGSRDRDFDHTQLNVTLANFSQSEIDPSGSTARRWPEAAAGAVSADLERRQLRLGGRPGPSSGRGLPASQWLGALSSSACPGHWPGQAASPAAVPALD